MALSAATQEYAGSISISFAISDLATKEEVKTRGLLLKSCVDDLKTYAEEVEEVKKKNQELEHLNHRLICETSSFVERNSYFSPEM